MAESKSEKAEPAPAPRAPASVAAGPGESSDARVQAVLAARQTAVENGDTAGIAAADARLAELGY